MNREIVKAMHKKEKESNTICEWLEKSGYMVIKIIYLPIWILVWAKDQFIDYLNSRQEWSEKRAQKILSYYVPRMAVWDAKNKTFYFNYTGWNMLCHREDLKFYDRRWWNCNCRKVRNYLIAKFEMEGFEKIVNDVNNGWTRITFKMIEK